MRRQLVLVLVVLGAIAVAGCADDGGSSSTTSPEATTTTAAPAPSRGDAVAVPTVEGPITGGERNGLPSNPTPPELLEEFGYVEEEFFISGDAVSYAPVGTLGQDGMWEVEPAGSAPFTTRILVRRPADPADANGVVGVEWFNVTGGQDADPDFGFIYPELLGTGTTWVGVSAQFTGVDGTGVGIVEGIVASPLKVADPTRYAPLEHPGDDYSYDIYSQAAQALRRPDGADPLGGIVADHVIALGESQSAGRLTTYIDAVHPVADIYDGFLVHSRIVSAPLAADQAMPPLVNFRTDLDDPILFFQTETDVARGVAIRQPDTDRIVSWEVAGTAHADQSQLDWGAASAHVLDPDRELPDFESDCGGTLNQGPQPLVLQGAWGALVDWVRDGSPPAGAPELEIDGGAIARDDDGIALGGIRTPDVDVPIAVHTGVPRPDVSVVCSLFGATTPLPAAEIAARYPTHEDYVDQVRASAEAALEQGFLLPSGAEAFVAEADEAPVPG